MRITTKLRRDGLIYRNLNGDKAVCLYFSVSYFGVRTPKAVVSVGLRSFRNSIRIAIVKSGGKYYWMEEGRRLTFHDLVQRDLKRLKAKTCIYVRVTSA